MNKNIVIIFAIFLLALPMVFAAPTQENNNVVYDTDDIWSTETGFVINITGCSAGQTFKLYNITRADSSTVTNCTIRSYDQIGQNAATAARLNYTDIVGDTCSYGALGFSMNLSTRYLIAGHGTAYNSRRKLDVVPPPIAGTNIKWTETFAVNGGTNIIETSTHGRSIKSLWGDCVSAAVPDPMINNTVPIINISYPIFGSTIDNSSVYPLWINGTITIQNGSIGNLTINNTNWKNNKNLTNFNFTLNGTFTEGKWDIRFTVNSTAGNTTVYNLSFYIDITAPSATSSLNNNKTLFDIYRNVTFQINLSDNLKLYFFNVSTPEGFVLNFTGVNVTNYFFNGSINTSTYGVGIHNITSEFCDAHTALSITDWNFDKIAGDKGVRFNFNSDYLRIYPEDSTTLSKFDVVKKNDRYSFDIKKNLLNLKNTQVFIVDSSYPIDIIGDDSRYHGWLVIPKLKKWVDFNTQGTKITYDIKRLSPTSIKISIDGLTDNNFVLESAGDLNCDFKIWKYYLFNYTASFSSPVIETNKEKIDLIINFGGISIDGNGSLNYLGVSYPTTKNVSSNQLNLTINLTIPSISNNLTNVDLFWNLVLNNQTFDSINFTQTVQRIQLTGCSQELQNVLNISIYNEQSPTQLLEAKVDAIFNIWTNDSGTTLNFSFSFNDQTNYSICLSPNTTITSDAYFLYNTSGGFAERWFLDNAKLSGNTQILSLFNFISQTGISDLRGILRDTNYNVYPLLTSKLQRFYPSENLWRTVQMDRSDNFGQIIFYIIESSQDYRIVFESNGIVIDQTETLKFLCTSGICSTTFIVESSGTSASAIPQFSLSYDNNTQMVQMNFSDTTGLTTGARLWVQSAGVNNITICDTSLTSSSGTINCNTTGYEGTLTARVYSSASPQALQKIIFIVKQVIDSFYSKLKSSGLSNEGMFWAVGISGTLTMAGIIFNPVVGIIFYIFSLFGIWAMGISNYITLPLITLMAVIGIIISILVGRNR